MAAFTPYQASVGTTATLIGTLPGGKYSITVTNTGAAAVYLSNSPAVTTSTGATIPAAATWVLEVNVSPAGQALYGVSGTAGQVVTVLTGA